MLQTYVQCILVFNRPFLHDNYLKVIQQRIENSLEEYNIFDNTMHYFTSSLIYFCQDILLIFSYTAYILITE